MLDVGYTDKKERLCKCWGDENHFLTPVQDWIYGCIQDWYPGLDPELGSILEYEYSATK